MSARFGGLAIASGRYQLIRSLSTKLLATYLFIVIATLLIMGIAMWVLFPHFEIRNRTAELPNAALRLPLWPKRIHGFTRFHIITIEFCGSLTVQLVPIFG